MRVDGNSYYTELQDKTGFIGKVADERLVSEAFDFAYGMTYGNVGEHRNHRTNGRENRNLGDIFCNTFQGKLAEYLVKNELENDGFDVGNVDTQQERLGVWDRFDLEVEDKILSVKSCKYFSEFLFLETGDYDLEGNYRHSDIQSDLFTLVKISPVCQALMKSNRMFFGNQNEEVLRELILGETWKYFIAGFITHDMFVECIENEQIIPQDALLNGKMPMDAENYYYASGEMISFDDIAEYLNR